MKDEDDFLFDFDFIKYAILANASTPGTFGPLELLDVAKVWIKRQQFDYCQDGLCVIARDFA